MKVKRTKIIRPAFSTFLTGMYVLAALIQPAQGQSEIPWYSMQEAQQLAQKNDKKVLIYAGASWCVYCKKMDQQVFPKKQVIDSLTAYFYGVKLNIESRRPITFNGNRMTQFEFARKYGVRATPTFFFVNSEGKIIGAQPGFIPAATFSQLLGYIGSNAYREMEFGEYLKSHVKNSGQQ